MESSEICKLSETPLDKPIIGEDACEPGKPAKLPLGELKLHYVIHYMYRGTWDNIVSEEKEDDLGKIELYACNLCERRFKNHHDKKQYPGRGSMLCHLATEHGKLLEAMRKDDKVDMESEISKIGGYEKKFIETEANGIVEDQDLVSIKNSVLWLLEEERIANLKASGKARNYNRHNNITNASCQSHNATHSATAAAAPVASKTNNDPKTNSTPTKSSPTTLEKTAKNSENSKGTKPNKLECPQCDECKGNKEGGKLRSHIFLHYKDRFEARLDKLEKGDNCYYCDVCPKRKQLKGANKQGARLSAAYHLAVTHHEMRDVLKSDQNLTKKFVNDIYWDIDSSPTTAKEEGATAKPVEKTRGRPKKIETKLDEVSSDKDLVTESKKSENLNPQNSSYNEWVSSGDEDTEKPSPKAIKIEKAYCGITPVG